MCRLGSHRLKCEVTAIDLQQVTHSSFSQFTRINTDFICLLGAPLSTGSALKITLDARVDELNRALNRLSLISRQDVLLILRSSLRAPKLIYNLRSAPCANHPSLTEYDQCLRKGLEVILNINLSESQWLQSTLPIGMGGLGTRRVSSLALPAFLVSAAGTLELQSNLLKEPDSHPDPNMEKLLAMWQGGLGINITREFPTPIQSKWDQPLLQKTSSDLHVFHPLTEKHDQARWRAVITAQHAGV